MRPNHEDSASVGPNLRGSSDALEGTSYLAFAAMPFYLVERFVPSMSEHDLVSGVARLTTLGTDAARHLLTVVIAAEDTGL